LKKALPKIIHFMPVFHPSSRVTTSDEIEKEEKIVQTCRLGRSNQVQNAEVSRKNIEKNGLTKPRRRRANEIAKKKKGWLWPDCTNWPGYHYLSIK